jgi:hypothetical protein
VDNVFGAGAAYAFINNGIYCFHGSGPAEARLRRSAPLPVRVGDLLEVQAGTRPGDPIYLLGKGTRGTMTGLLYRSTDGGKSWHRLLDGNGLTPNTTLDSAAGPSPG